MTADEWFRSGLERFKKAAESSQGRFWRWLRRSRAALIVLALSMTILQLRDLPGDFATTTFNAATIMAPRTRAKDVRLVLIDQQEYDKEFAGRSPLDAAKFSYLLGRIAAGHPSAIVVDLDTSHSMFRALQVPANIPIVWSVPNRPAGDTAFDPEQPIGGKPLPAKSVAALDLIPHDEHGIVRSYWRRFEGVHGRDIPSLEYAAASVRKFNGVRLNDINSKDNERLLDFRYWVPSMLASDVITQSDWKGWGNGLLSGEIVVLGGSFRAARDRHATPIRQMDGAEIVAQGIEAEIENTSIRPASAWLAGALQVIAGLILIGVYRWAGWRRAFLVSLLLIPSLSVLGSLILFHRVGVWLALTPVLVSLLLTELYSSGEAYLKLYEKETWLGKAEGLMPGVKTENKDAEKASAAGV